MSVTSIGIDYDSDQQIMSSTIIANGKWKFFVGEELLVEAVAPSSAEPFLHAVNGWCNIVRSRIKNKQELNTEEILAKKKARREGYGNSPAVGSNNTSNSDDVHNSKDVNLYKAKEQRSIDEDTEAYASNKVEELEQRKFELERELDKVNKAHKKWIAIKEVCKED